MLKQRLEEDLKKAIESLGFPPIDIVCDIPKNTTFGDYTTNIALQLAKRKMPNVKQSPEEIAKAIIEKLKPQHPVRDNFSKIEIAGGGFINFFIKDQILVQHLGKLQSFKIQNPKKILVEYGHVNPLKEIHIGHLRTFILGESLARILESRGHKVFRANYQGDIGLHIAKAVWGIKKLGLPSKELTREEKADFLGQAYALGNTNYDQDSQAKKEIDEINTKLYQKDPQILEIYRLAREWSLDYFEPVYDLLGVRYDHCFFESQVFQEGKKIVLEHLGKVFERSDGAIIFPGEKYGLHNRVFITRAGNPTYEGKEVGLAKAEYEAFPYDLSIHVVASEQEGYFKVVIKAIEQIYPHLVGKKYHLSYGLVDLAEGKMSSRTGNVVTVNDLVGMVSERVREVAKEGALAIDQETVKKVALGAIKYSYLKYSPQPNMVFDLAKSVSLQGDSGPYIQYTYARIKSVFRKISEPKPAGTPRPKADQNTDTADLNPTERQLAVKLLHFPQVVGEAAEHYHPNLIAGYLAELAHTYNLFYQEQRIIGSDKESLRLQISQKVAEVLEKGLGLLGIEAPESM